MNYLYFFFIYIKEMTISFIHNLHLTSQLDTNETLNKAQLSQENYNQNHKNINQNNSNNHNIYVNEHFSDLNHCDYFYYMDPSGKEEEDSFIDPLVCN